MPRAKNRKTNQKRSYGQGSFVDNYYTQPAKESRHLDEDGADDFDQHASHAAQRSKRARLSAPPPPASSQALTQPDHFSPEMIKYWKQRYWLFSLFDGSSRTGQLPLLDAESWFSVTPEPIAARIAQRCRSGTVLDAFCGAGGNAIQFAMTCQRVIAIDVDDVKLRMARHNARVYGVEAYITFLRGDWRQFARDWLEAHGKAEGAKQAAVHSGGETTATVLDEDEVGIWQECAQTDVDVVFLSPPWGGVNYRTLNTPTNRAAPSSDEAVEEDQYYSLEALAPDGGKKLMGLARSITANVCLYVPTSTDLAEIAALAKGDTDVSTDEGTTASASAPAYDVDVEEQWLNGRCKALACYFGELAQWKEEEEEEEELLQS